MLEVEEVDEAVTPQHLVGKVRGPSLGENLLIIVVEVSEKSPGLNFQFARSPLQEERQSRNAFSRNLSRSCCRTGSRCRSCAPAKKNVFLKKILKEILLTRVVGQMKKISSISPSESVPTWVNQILVNIGNFTIMTIIILSKNMKIF